MQIKEKINEIKSQFDSDFVLLSSDKIDKNTISYKYLGRKGLLSTIYPLLSSCDNKDKPKVGKLINDLKTYINDRLSSVESSQNSSDFNKTIDVTLPENILSSGSIHPLTKIVDEIESIFQKIGFSSVYGSEIETDYYNFEALNIPRHHPARDMQDTFYTDH